MIDRPPVVPRAHRSGEFERFFGRMIGLAFVIVSGCAQPVSQTDNDATTPGGGRFHELDPTTSSPIAALAGPVRPGMAFLSDDLADRHGMRARFEPRNDPAAVLYEGFSDVGSIDDLKWLRIGEPVVELVERDKDTCLRIGPSPGPNATSGLSRQLFAESLAGRTLLCQLRTKYRSDETLVDRSRPFAATHSHPTFRFVILREGGSEQDFSWPLVWAQSPGWELQRVIWKAPADLLGARLEIRLPDDAPSLEFDDLLIYDLDAEDASEPRSPSDNSLLPATGGNLLVGGDFETGHKGFGVLAYSAQAGGTDGAAQRVPLSTPWLFDQPGRVGRTCLAVPVGATGSELSDDGSNPAPETGFVRTWFGPIFIHQPAGYVLSFWARATAPTPLDVSVWVDGVQSGPVRMHIEESWQQRSNPFLIMGSQVPARIYVTIDVPTSASDPSAGIWLDAVSLTPEAAPAEYRAPNLFELGILDSAGDPLDVNWLFDRDRPVRFSLRMVNYDQRAFVGTVCLDVVDAMNRSVWSADLPVSLSPRGGGSDSARSERQIPLGRGYYRVFATAWLGDKGNGTPISQQVRPLAVLNLGDPLPIGAPVGLPVAPGRFSMRMSQWGVGWARVPIEGPAAFQNLNAWTALLHGCQRQNLEIIGAYEAAGLDLPPCVGSRCILPAERALRLRAQAADRNQPGRPVIQNGGWARPVIAVGDLRQLSTQLVDVFTDGWPIPGDAIELKLPQTSLPEEIEPVLQRLGEYFPPDTDLRLWDESLRPVLSSAQGTDRGFERLAVAGEQAARIPLDPALEASELVRALAIRLWYGFDHVTVGCFPLVVRDPSQRTANIDFGSLESQLSSLAELDHAPKPAIAALDFLSEMLNDAVPAAWIDGYMGARAVVFDRGADRGAVLLWRPFGLTPTFHRLVGVSKVGSSTETGFTGAIEVRNCFGQFEPVETMGDDLIVPVSAMALWLTAEGPAWRDLLQALHFALGEPESAEKN